MKFKQHIFYISTLCSPKVLNYIFETSINKPGLAIQKFHRLLAEGLSMQRETYLETLSSIPVIHTSHKKRIWAIKSEIINNIHYHYIPMINLPILKNGIVTIYTFIKILINGVFKNSDKKVVICDVLNLSITASAALACKLTGTKVIAIVTDLPSLIVSSASPKKSIYSWLVSKLISKFDGYILLTEQMNAIVNPKHRPYLLMEGLVDINMGSSENTLSKKAKERIILYAGGIYEKYGIKKLIEAFMLLTDADLRLYIYGSGEMEIDMPKYMLSDKRISYMGVVPNNEVVKMQLTATLLINPRPTDEEFTKYSFPSKNMEYMVSGTPLLTTRLPGMPEEYNPFVYLFDDESVEGMHLTLKLLLSKSKEELHEFGLQAKNWVLNEKSNYKQGLRILEFIDELKNHQHV
jgi:glycosyltransferase involved in cell wall biosynthesis